MMSQSYTDLQIDSQVDQYHAILEGYDRVHFKLQHMATTLVRPKSLRDIGCAKEEIITVLRKHCPLIAVSGVGSPERPLKLARRHHHFQGTDFQQSDLRNLATGRRFDVVLATEVLGYFFAPNALLDATLSNLESGGRGYIFSTFSSGSPYTFLTTSDQPQQFEAVRPLPVRQANHRGSTGWPGRGHCVAPFRDADKTSEVHRRKPRTFLHGRLSRWQTPGIKRHKSASAPVSAGV